RNTLHVLRTFEFLSPIHLSRCWKTALGRAPRSMESRHRHPAGALVTGGSVSALSLSRTCTAFTQVAARRIAQPPIGDLCHEAPTRAVTRTSRSSATGSIDNSPGRILPPLMIRAFGAHCQDRTHAVQQKLYGYS